MKIKREGDLGFFEAVLQAILRNEAARSSPKEFVAKMRLMSDENIWLHFHHTGRWTGGSGICVLTCCETSGPDDSVDDYYKVRAGVDPNHHEFDFNASDPALYQQAVEKTAAIVLDALLKATV